MYPTLFEVSLFGRVLALDSHGLCITIGALLGLWLAVRQGRTLPLTLAARRDLGLELLIVGVIGARLLFVLACLPAYAATCRDGLDGGTLVPCTRALWLWEGGLSLPGGIAAALSWLAWRSRGNEPSTRRLADVFAPGLALAQGLGRIGCLLAGCCYGRATSGLGLRFPEDSVAFQDLLDRGLLPPGSETTPPLYPVQAWDALGHLVLCGLLIAISRRSPRSGTVLAAFLLGDALLRSTLAPFRGDSATSPLLTSALFVAAAIVVLAWPRRAAF